MWTWSQGRGELYDAQGERIASGYSGHGDGRNNPEMQMIHDVGPIPQGQWMISEPRNTPSHGPYVLPLTAKAGTETFSREGFLIHGDSIEHPGSASLGCLILARAIRERIWTSGDHDLDVVA